MALPHQDILVLLAMADHADHEGKHMYPSLGLIAWKTGYSLRQVRRIVRNLEARQILLRVQAPEGKVSTYTLQAEQAPKKPRYATGRAAHPGHGDLGNHVLGNHDPGHLRHTTPDILSTTPDICDTEAYMDARAFLTVKNLPHEPSASPEPRASTSDTLQLIMPDVTQDTRPHKHDTTYSPAFLEFWKRYPVKKDKRKAWTAWQTHQCDRLQEVVLRSIAEHLHADAQWAKDGGQYIPHPTTYLNGTRWEDEFPSPSRTHRAVL